MNQVEVYHPKNKVRIVTAASLFDGHDAAINIMRRIIQASGAEVIHLGHDRSVQEVVNCAIQEDAQAIAMTSYQGGHMEYFKYMYDLLKEKNCGHIKIFGGGGGVILPDEIEELQHYGITRIYSPDDGRSLGLQGMINDLLKQSDFPLGNHVNGEVKALSHTDHHAIARLISAVENFPEEHQPVIHEIELLAQKSKSAVLGITGTGGAGKSSLVDELVRRFLADFSSENNQDKNKSIAILSVDPSKRKTGGALLGDRIRMNSIRNDRVYMRSLATRQANLALSRHVRSALNILKAANFDLIILETAGIGQSDTEITDHSDVSLYVMTPEYGAASQLEKIDMLDFADLIALNKFDKRGALDALRDVRKQYQRNHQQFGKQVDEMPVFGTIASQFNDPGMNQLYRAVMEKIAEKTSAKELSPHLEVSREMSEKIYIIPPARIRYLSEITETIRKYEDWTKKQVDVATKLFGLYHSILLFSGPDVLQNEDQALKLAMHPGSLPLEKGEPEGDQISNFTGRSSGKLHTHPALKTFRRELRNQPTPAESKLWSLLNNRQLQGRKFRRQHSIGPYILDFYCPEEKLGIELDGDLHFQPNAAEYDLERSQFLNTYGIKVIRFENKYVFEQPEAVLDSIAGSFEWIKQSPPAPPFQGGEDTRFSKPGQQEINKLNKTYEELNENTFHSAKEKSLETLTLEKGEPEGDYVAIPLIRKFFELKKNLDPRLFDLLKGWKQTTQNYRDEFFIYRVRGKELKIKTHTESLSHTQIAKVATPKFESWGEILQWVLHENFPGEFPYTAGIYPFKREGEDPTRMFAGEGGPERTNKRFHYVSLNLPAKRLSTAFDSVTLYGNDPDFRPDIYGKVGNSGVSICCLDDAKKLYSGFHLTDPKTSVSMTINGPASIISCFFFNAAIDQQCELYIKEHGLTHEVNKKIDEIFKKKNLTRPEYQSPPAAPFQGGELAQNGDALDRSSGTLEKGKPEDQKLPEGNDGLGLMLLGVTGDQVLDAKVYKKIKEHTLQQVRGTVQADILKEDQAQNTCIFSTEFSLRLMGDMQEYFIKNKVRNFYSVSISGYHIAEAGANPISQLAFTLANGFTYVEYYLSRGMKIDDFAPNLSFFFSNGIDPEYAVIGRVARKIWAKAMKLKYGANERSQMLKYHIQTSGRSLHAQEIDFNDIRTTLQALYAIYDNCNSLHTNAYDEAITTPTEGSVRRAMAIQLIINRELGLAKNENPMQGSFIIEELTDLVEEAVLLEFDRITERGGVLGAMETMYQRGKIQEESLYYETLKHTGEYPIIGVNTFLSSKGSPTIIPKEVIRSTEEEKKYQITMLKELHERNAEVTPKLLSDLQTAAVQNKNMFESLMEASKYCSLGQITNALFEVGGQYRRNM